MPNDKILDQSILKTFADDKIRLTEKLKSVFGRVEIIVGKREMLVTSIFSYFSQCFQKASFSRSLKFRIVWLRVNLLSAGIELHCFLDSEDQDGASVKIGHVCFKSSSKDSK